MNKSNKLCFRMGVVSQLITQLANEMNNFKHERLTDELQKIQFDKLETMLEKVETELNLEDLILELEEDE